jgi:hypothetical protein
MPSCAFSFPNASQLSLGVSWTVSFARRRQLGIADGIASSSGRYEAAFRDHKINERVLPNLTQEDLKEIGVGPVGHRRMHLDAIAALRSDGSGKANPADVTPPSATPSTPPEDRAERSPTDATSTVVTRRRLSLSVEKFLRSSAAQSC